MVSTRKIIEYIFFSLVSMVGTVGVGYMRDISSSMVLLTKSVTELNLKIELLTQKMVIASQSLDDHEHRLRRIETGSK